MIGLIGKKLGQTRVYDDAGNAVSVTIVLAGPNRVLQCKTADTKDGYSAVQLGFDDQKIDGRATQPMRGHFKKAGTPVVKFVREFRNFSLEVKLGDEVGPDIFEVFVALREVFRWETDIKGTVLGKPVDPDTKDD